VNESANVFFPDDTANALYATIERSRLNLAAGLKKAGTLGGTFAVREDFGTTSTVLPSIVLINSATP
jgi:hypothetical protein